MVDDPGLAEIVCWRCGTPIDRHDESCEVYETRASLARLVPVRRRPRGRRRRGLGSDDWDWVRHALLVVAVGAGQVLVIWATFRWGH